ncbi:MAG: guanylate kinase [Clostridiales bacterium]|nr:guanylate kinase [Clostridiales bacterium]
MKDKKEKGLLIVISGPSGAGKGTIYGKVRQKMPDLKPSISVTTRAPRPGEQDGVHYYFRTVEEHKRMQANDEFLEWADVYGNLYGTPKAPVFAMLEAGEDVLFEIDVQGAKQIKEKYPDSILIFIMTPSFAELEKRLRGRGTEKEEIIQKRLGSARGEVAQYKLFDYFVTNDNADEAAERVAGIIAAEKYNIMSNEQKIQQLLAERYSD